MEGTSGAPRAAAADLVRNNAVVEADVVVAGGGRRGGAAASGGLVAAAVDQDEHGFPGATVPDLNVVPAGDTLVYPPRSTLHLLSPSLVVVRVR
jgi:hypothetical protein